MAPPLTIGWAHNLKTAPASTDAIKIIAIAAAFSSIAVVSIAIRFVQRWRRGLVVEMGLILIWICGNRAKVKGV